MRAAPAPSATLSSSSPAASGTTAVAVRSIREGRLHWISVGDSAIFLMRDGGVFQLNREHTWLNQLYLEELEPGAHLPARRSMTRTPGG
ncbi:MAG: hypothetical protein V8R40_09065 [Dysosmobacter sp.]